MQLKHDDTDILILLNYCGAVSVHWGWNPWWLRLRNIDFINNPVLTVWPPDVAAAILILHAYSTISGPDDVFKPYCPPFMSIAKRCQA